MTNINIYDPFQYIKDALEFLVNEDDAKKRAEMARQAKEALDEIQEDLDNDL